MNSRNIIDTINILKNNLYDYMQIQITQTLDFTGIKQGLNSAKIEYFKNVITYKPG